LPAATKHVVVSVRSGFRTATIIMIHDNKVHNNNQRACCKGSKVIIRRIKTQHCSLVVGKNVAVVVAMV
jgi:hypothetical protein